MLRPLLSRLKRFPLLAGGLLLCLAATPALSAGGSTAARKLPPIAIGVNGTPASFIVNRRTGKATLISGAVPAKEFQTVIDNEIAALRALPPPAR